MTELEQRLAQLAQDARWPATPDLVGPVRAAIDVAPAPAPHARPRRSRRRPLLVALLALVVGGGALAAPGVGSGLLERLGLRGAEVKRVARLPATPLGAPLALGERSSLQDARRRAGFQPLRPAALGMPAETWVDGRVVALVYRARSGRPILLTQVPGSAGRYLRKFVRSDARSYRVDGAPAVLLRGPHVVAFDARGGGVQTQAARLAKNTLMWERDGLLLRLEAEQPPGELLRIARSVG